MFGIRRGESVGKLGGNIVGSKTAAEAAACQVHDEVMGAKDETEAEKESEYPSRISTLGPVAGRADDTARQGFWALHPSEGLRQDPREFQAPVSTQIDQAKAKIKLEVMTSKSIIIVNIFLDVAAVISLLTAILSAVLNAQRGGALSTNEAAFAIEGISRTVGVVLMLFLVILFPFRVIQYSIKNKDAHVHPEQFLVIILCIIIMATPGMSVYGIYLFWKKFGMASGFAHQQAPDKQGEAFSKFSISTTSDQEGVIRATANMSVILQTAIFLSFGLIMHFFGILTADVDAAEAGKKHETEHVDQSELNSIRTNLQLPNSSSDRAEPNDIEAGADSIEVPASSSNLRRSHRPSTQQSPSLADDNIKVQDDSNMPNVPNIENRTGYYNAMLRKVNMRLVSLTLVYFITLLVLVNVFSYIPSQIPLVSMINVLKVCPFYAPVNTGINARNCDPDVLNGVPFARAMSVSAQFLLDVAVLYHMNIISKRADANLKRLPYEANRSNQLGLRYFNGIRRMTFSFMLLGSIIILAVSQRDLFLYRIIQSPEPSDSVSVLSQDYSPLYQVGINFLTLGFGPYYLLLSCFLFSLAYGYLPADSHLGIRGFFGGGKATTLASKYDVEKPVYIAREEDIAGLQQARDEAWCRMAAERKRVREQRRPQRQSSTDLEQEDKRGAEDPEEKRDETDEQHGDNSSDEPPMSFFASLVTPTTCSNTEQYERLSEVLRPKFVDNKQVDKTKAHWNSSMIAEQINANILCMETEILLLNLSFIAYCFGSSKDKQQLSGEKKQVLVGKLSRYRLVSHVENPDTEIQAVVFVDSKHDYRIYVAFRGTATSKNVWQDLKSNQVTMKCAEDVEPLLLRPDDAVSKRAAAHKPCVHSGFFFAYKSIRESVMKVICALVCSKPRGCVIFACGHSLGGALATHFAFDIGLRFQVRESNVHGIQLTTFGSPRIGNFSYVCRHRRLVPTAHRFIIGGDPASKLPPVEPFEEYTKRGFYHRGVEILLDVDRVNLIVAPSFIERMIEHGWGGYRPINHVIASYVLALSLWCARVHSSSIFTPDWWLPVINFTMKAQRVRIEKMTKTENNPWAWSALREQFQKEGAIIFTDGKRVMQQSGIDTSKTLLALSGHAAQMSTRSPMLDPSMTTSDSRVSEEAKESSDQYLVHGDKHGGSVDEDNTGRSFPVGSITASKSEERIRSKSALSSSYQRENHSQVNYPFFSADEVSVTSQLLEQKPQMSVRDFLTLPAPTSTEPVSTRKDKNEPSQQKKEQGIPSIEVALSSVGILFKRSERVRLLYSAGVTSVGALAHLSPNEFSVLRSVAPELIDDDFVKTVLQSLSVHKCLACFYQVTCPNCMEIKYATSFPENAFMYG